MKRIPITRESFLRCLYELEELRKEIDSENIRPLSTMELIELARCL